MNSTDTFSPRDLSRIHGEDRFLVERDKASYNLLASFPTFGTRSAAAATTPTSITVPDQILPFLRSTTPELGFEPRSEAPQASRMSELPHSGAPVASRRR